MTGKPALDSRNVLTHERKVQKHEAKLSVSNIFLSVLKHFQVSKTEQIKVKVIVHFFWDMVFYSAVSENPRFLRCRFCNAI